MPLASPVTLEEHAVAAATLGDIDALGSLFELLHDKLLRDLEIRARRNMALAEEVAAMTWEKVARSIHTYDPKRGPFERWLFGIARNTLNSQLRGWYRTNESLTGDRLTFDGVSADETVEDVIERRCAAQRLAAEVAGLSAAQRQVVQYRYFDGLTLAETAALMDRNVNGIKQLQWRAVQTLRRRLGCDFEGILTSVATPGAAADGDEQGVVSTHHPGATTGGLP